MEYVPQTGLEIGYAVLWWLMLEGAGLLVLAGVRRLCRHLPDRGYAFSKAVGLVAVNYVLWMGSTLGLLRNTWGGILLAAGIAWGLSQLLSRRGQASEQGDSLWGWARREWRTVLAVEVVFTSALVLWALYKAYDPNIAITEKPMEFAFLNAITRSGRFPAYDPWMSGHGISYYYFGYIMMATLAKLGAIPTRFAFNLGTATLFALTATGAFGVVYNLVRAAASRAGPGRAVNKAIYYGVLAAIVLPLSGNMEGALEFLHANGVGVTVNEPGNVTGPFWEWIDVKNLTHSGTISETWHPTDGWWWWRASRVVHDKGLTGSSMEVIDEFPAFSFLLGDMHPHVLAYPFVFMVIGLALNLLLATAAPTRGEWAAIYGLVGAIGFLNTWDLPFYFFLIAAAYALNRYRHPELGSPSLVGRLFGNWPQRVAPWLRQAAARAVELGAACLLLYLPYWIYSRPQAGAGILPNLFNVTRLAHLFLMFGPFLVALAVLMGVWGKGLWEKGRLKGEHLVRQGLPVWVGTMLFFPVLLALVLVPAVALPSVRTYIDDTLANQQVQEFLGVQTLGSLIQVALRIRLGFLPEPLQEIRMPAGPWSFLALSLLIAGLLFLFLRSTFPRWFKSRAEEQELPHPSLQFAGLMAFTGLMLVFSVEFVYLRDVFGTRMNTVFKFYFQAWALLGLTAVFAVYYVLEGAGAAGERAAARAARGTFGALMALFLVSGLLYPLGASISRSGGFAGPATLDGLAFVARDRPDEYAAVAWLNENVPGRPVIVEAVRGSFAYEYARISSRTGLPTVMGWTGHVGQWHGFSEEISRREQDVKQLYAGSISDARRIMDQYDVRYVVVGYLERSEFGGTLAKFGQFMDVAFEQGDTVIYERR